MEKRSLSLAGHRTSVALEREFWDAVAAAAAEDGVSLPAFIAEIDRRRGARNLASALRVAVLARLQARLDDRDEAAAPTNAADVPPPRCDREAMADGVG